eukprot:scaffold175_cov414-Prasinococcus_capsulatus_cf.AAC.12
MRRRPPAGGGFRGTAVASAPPTGPDDALWRRTHLRRRRGGPRSLADERLHVRCPTYPWINTLNIMIIPVVTSTALSEIELSSQVRPPLPSPTLAPATVHVPAAPQRAEALASSPSRSSRARGPSRRCSNRHALLLAEAHAATGGGGELRGRSNVRAAADRDKALPRSSLGAPLVQGAPRGAMDATAVRGPGRGGV